MTQEEANAVAQVIGFASGGCSYCIEDLGEKLNEAGLGYRFEVDESARKDGDPHPHEWVCVTATPNTEESGQ